MMIGHPGSNEREAYGIRYSPYLAFVSVFAEQPEARLGGGTTSLGDSDAATRMTTAAWRFRRSLERDYGDYRAAAGRKPTVKLAHYLYNPVYWTCFGVADAVAVTLLDGFDSFLRLTGEESLPIERAYLAFCPTLESLGIQSGGDSPFIEFTQLFADRAQPKATSSRPSAEEQVYKPAEHRFYADRPLLIVTRLKTGFGGLESGLLFQRAVFRAISRAAERTIEKLGNHLGTRQFEQLEITETDLKHTKIVLADVQAAEDILVLITCRNYSVACAIVHAIRDICLGDILKDPEGLGRQISRLMQRSEAWPKIFRTRYGAKEHFSGLTSFAGNHCFSATYSVAGVSQATACQPEKAACSGIAEVHVRLDISPGHFVNVTERVFEALRDRPAQGDGPNAIRRYGPSSEFDCFSVGRHDYDFSLAQAGMDDLRYAVSVKSFLRASHLVTTQFEKEAKRKPLDGTTGLLGTSSWLVVPVPRLLGRDALAHHVRRNHRAFPAILTNIRSRLFGAQNRVGRAGADGAPLSMKRLQSAMRQSRIPLTLRRTIEYLFQNFSHCVSNVFLFESILDLYDIYLALHLLLTDDLVRKPRNGRSAVLLAPSIATLSELVDAIHDATSHRISILPRTETHDWAVDVRGGLSRLAAAVDVPLKCGIGLLRWCGDCGFGETDASDEAGKSPMFAGVMRLSFHPDSVCHHVSLMPEQKVYISQLDINVGHLFFPADFATYLHEAAHLILTQMYRNERHRKELPPRDLETVVGRNRKQRGDEIFAEMLTGLFIFGDDWKLSRRSYVAKYSLYPGSVGTNGYKTLQGLAEILIRGFFVTEPVRVMAGKKEFISVWAPHAWGRLPGQDFSEDSDPDIDEASRLFRNYLDDVCPFFSEYHSLLEEYGEGAVTGYLCRSFRELFAPTLEMSTQLWRKALAIYQKYAKKRQSRGAKCGRAQLAAATRSAIESGQSWIPGVLARDAKIKVGSDELRIDELTLVCQLICEYVRFCFQGLDVRKGMHVSRDKSGRIDYRDGLQGKQRSWSGFQLERGYPRLHCCDPKLRGELLKREIVILKSLWDMSTVLKARRLSRMLDGESDPRP